VEKKRMLKSLVSGVAFAVLLTPAIADEYWVVLDPSTQQCSVVEKKSQETATDATEGTGTDVSQGATTDTAQGAGLDKSQGTATDTPDGTRMDNSQAAAIERTGTDNSQETATDKTEGTTTDKSRGTATNRAEAQKITETGDLLRLLAEAAESSKTAQRVGSVYPTRAEAEYRMSIMRKCGLAK
jgi:hypothetical protein